MFAGTVFAVLSGIAYGMLGIFGKWAYALNLDLGQVLLCRFGFGATFLLLFLLATHPGALRMDLRGLGLIAATSLFIFCAQSYCFFGAVQRIPVSTAVLILYAYPATVTLASALIYKTPLTRRILGGLALVLGGCCLVCYDAFARDLDPTGLALAAGAMLFLSCYLLISQTITKGRRPLGVTFYMLVFTGLGFVVLEGPGRVTSIPVEALPVAVGLGLIPTALSISLLFLAIERIGSARASIGSSVEPVAAMAASAVFLSEAVAWPQLLGAGLVLTGIVICNLTRAKRATTPLPEAHS